MKTDADRVRINTLISTIEKLKTQYANRNKMHARFLKLGSEEAKFVQTYYEVEGSLEGMVMCGLVILIRGTSCCQVLNDQSDLLTLPKEDDE
jgi:hypothetical protein